MSRSPRTANNATTLPGRYYTSPDIYQEETERIFLRRWFYAGRVSTLAEPGSYFVVDVDTESIIVLRDANGTVRAFHNLCRHRGTRLCAEPTGTFSKSIRCSYHAWTYGLDGSLIGAPHMNEVPGFDRSDYPLHAVSVAEWEGGVFLNLNSDGEAFTDAFAPLIDKFAPWKMSELKKVHQITYDVAANWKLVFQNYSECYHCPSLHPQLNKLTPYRHSMNDLQEGPFLGGPMRLAREGGSMTMSGETCGPAIGDLTGEYLNLVHYYTVFPNMLLSLFPDYVLIHRIERLRTHQTRVICDWLFAPDTMASSDYDPTGAIEFWNMTNKQDWQVSELSQRGISSRAYQPGPYSALESMIAAWDREYLRALSPPLDR